MENLVGQYTESEKMFKEIGFKRMGLPFNDELKSFTEVFLKIVPFDDWSNNIFGDEEFKKIVKKNNFEQKYIFIEFYLLTNTIHKKVKIGNEWFSEPIYIDEIKAINKRLEELMWLNRGD